MLTRTILALLLMVPACDSPDDETMLEALDAEADLLADAELAADVDAEPLGATPPFKVATFNIGDGPLSAKVDDIVDLADRGVTIIGLQEASDRGALLGEVRERAGMGSWRWCRVDHDGGPAVPIMFDSAVWKIGTQCGGFLAVEARYLGPEGAGPPESKDKYVTAFVLEHLASGRNVRVMNTHFIPSARNESISEPELTRRKDHVRDHVAKLVARIGDADDHPMPVVLTGDFNGPGSWPLLDPLQAIGLTGWSGQATHGDSILDHVVRRNLDQDGAAFVNTSSDHHAVVKTLR
jgi:hypothetical protein